MQKKAIPASCLGALDDEQYQVLVDDNELSESQTAVCYYNQVQRFKRKRNAEGIELQRVSSQAPPIVPTLQTLNLQTEQDMLNTVNLSEWNTYMDETLDPEAKINPDAPDAFKEKLKTLPPELADFLKDRKCNSLNMVVWAVLKMLNTQYV